MPNARVPVGKDITPLVCPEGHHSVEVYRTRFFCRSCQNQGGQSTYDIEELRNLKEEN